MARIRGIGVRLVLRLARKEIEVVAEADALHARRVVDERCIRCNFDRPAVAGIHLICLHQADRITDAECRTTACKLNADVDIAQIFFAVRQIRGIR